MLVFVFIPPKLNWQEFSASITIYVHTLKKPRYSVCYLNFYIVLNRFDLLIGLI